jgi:hypothetical protein
MLTIQKQKDKHTVAIDADTDESLNWLREQLESPKLWILRRLVREEIARVKKLEVTDK